MIPSITRCRTMAQVVTAICLAGACAANAQLATQGSIDLGSRFASSTITSHDEARRYPGFFFDTDDNLIFQGTALLSLISEAYGTKEFQIVDGPEWVSTPQLYDIKAVPPPAALVQSDRTQMLRSLLKDRFKLEVLDTSRDLPVLALEFAEQTPALQLTESPQLRVFPGRKEGLLLSRPNAAEGEPLILRAELTLATVASFLSRELDRNVVDMTGLEGIWTIELQGVATHRPGLEIAPLIDQLGLRLAERTLPMVVLSIVHIERPRLDE